MTMLTHYCSFCSKSQHRVRKLIMGHVSGICDECVELCNDILAEEHRRGKMSLPSHREMTFADLTNYDLVDMDEVGR